MCVCVVCRLVGVHICVSGWFRLCKPSTQPSVTKGPPCSEANHLFPTASRILALLSNCGPARQIHIHTQTMTMSTTCSYQQAGARAHTHAHTQQLWKCLPLKLRRHILSLKEMWLFISDPHCNLCQKFELQLRLFSTTTGKCHIKM